MSRERLVSEILQEFEQAPSRAEKIAVLRKYDHPRFREFLIYSLNESIEFDVEIPQYRPALEPAGLNYTYLESEIPKLYRFVKNHPRRPEGLTPQKQKQLLLVVLESLHKDEADLMVKMMKKNLGIKYLTKQIVKEAFPDI